MCRPSAVTVPTPVVPLAGDSFSPCALHFSVLNYAQVIKRKLARQVPHTSRSVWRSTRVSSSKPVLPVGITCTTSTILSCVIGSRSVLHLTPTLLMIRRVYPVKHNLLDRLRRDPTLKRAPKRAERAFGGVGGRDRGMVARTGLHGDDGDGAHGVSMRPSQKKVRTGPLGCTRGGVRGGRRGARGDAEVGAGGGADGVPATCPEVIEGLVMQSY